MKTLCAAISLFLLVTHDILGDDVIILAPSQAGGLSSERTGTVIDYSGTGLIFQETNERETTIPVSRVLEIRSQWQTEEIKGDSLQTLGDFAGAIEAYRAAHFKETRKWAARKLLAKLTQIYAIQGQWEQAGESFLKLIAEDAETPYFSSIPLAWRSSVTTASVGNVAEKMLVSKTLPTARLMAASWLLAGVQRNKAMETLGALASDIDPRISKLAIAQLWRAKLALATGDDAIGWQEQLRTFPPEIRSGPLLMLGDLQQRFMNYDQALLSYLEASLMENGNLANRMEGFMATAKLFAKLERKSELRLLLRNGTQQFPFLSKIRPYAEQWKTWEAALQ
jgi:tetratricopeptide (TPR) repeat protein